MNLSIPLADGFPPKLIFFAIFGFIWLLGVVFGKTKKTGPTPASPRRGAGAPALSSRQAEWKVRVEQLAGTVLNPPPMPTAKSRSRGKAKAQPVTVQQAAQLARQAAAKVQPRQAESATPAVAAMPRVSSRDASSDTTRNLKLLLQRGGVREAVLLTEILAPPLSMRE